MNREAPVLIPQPAEFAYSAGDPFILDAATPIQLSTTASYATVFAARELQHAIQQATGLALLVRKGGHPSSAEIALALRSGDDFGPEAYALQVTRAAITVSASTDSGLFYGVQTLKQLLRIYGARIPPLTIRDQPVLPHRGLMLDVSRGKVPTLATLLELADRLAHYKYNQLQLYVEHTFEFASHPDISAGVDPLTPDDILALDRYCRERHIELVPNLQSFGHQRHMLTMPEYSHLDEVGWAWSLTPAREDTYTLLGELYDDFLPNFSSNWLNVDCDETWDLGTGQSRALAEKLGKGRLYLQHILRLHELAAQRGRRMMLWADVLHHYPELVSELPDDVLLLDWSYEAAHQYATTEALGKSGRPFWVCPGTSSWNTFFPRLDNAVGNIRQFVRDGIAAGTNGMLLTDWGDYGHYQPLALSWYQYLFGACTAWTGGQTSVEDFDTAFAVLFVGGSEGVRAVSAMRRLGRAVTGTGLGRRNGSNLPLGLFEDPLGGRISRQTPTDSLTEVVAAADEAIAAWSNLPDPAMRHDYGFTARLIRFTACKLLHAQAQPDSATLAADQARLRAMQTEFEQCWLRHARRSEIGSILVQFQVVDRAYTAALEWLAGERTTPYQAEPYAFLWEKGMAEVRKLAAMTGVDMFPPDIREQLAQPVG